MPRVDSSSEAPSHLRKPIIFPFFGGSHCQPGCTHPFSEAASPESGGFPGKVLSHRPWLKTFDHSLNDDFIGHCRRLCS
jgi:hypothetical protein